MTLDYTVFASHDCAGDDDTDVPELAEPSDEEACAARVLGGTRTMNPDERTKAKKAKVTVRGRGGVTGPRGRGRGSAAAAPVSANGRPASKRGRSTSQGNAQGRGKGKERATEGVEDPDDEEVCATPLYSTADL